ISQALRNLLLLIGATVMMVVTSPKLSLAVFIAIPIIVIPLVAYGRSVRALSRQAQDTLAQASAYASESLAQVRVLQALTHEKAASARFGEAVERSFEAEKGRARDARDCNVLDLRERGRGVVVRRPGRALGHYDRWQALAIRALRFACRGLDGRAQRGVGRDQPRRGGCQAPARAP